MSKALNSVASFIGHYADEAASIARALTTILDGVALTPKDAATVNETINRLENAAQAIANSKPVAVTINAADIKAAVNEWMDKNAAAIIAKGKTDAGA